MKIQSDTTGKCASAPKDQWFEDEKFGGSLGQSTTIAECQNRNWASYCGTDAQYLVSQGNWNPNTCRLFSGGTATKLYAGGSFENRQDSVAPVPITDTPGWTNGQRRCNEEGVTTNTNGHYPNPMSCPGESYVKSVTWMEQANFGLVDVRMVCSDGTTHGPVTAGTYRQRDGKWNPEISCPDGFGEIQANEQSDFGIVNMRMKCVNKGSGWLMSNSNTNGNWRGDVRASHTGGKLTRINAQDQGGYGLVNAKMKFCLQGMSVLMKGLYQ